MEKLKNMMIMVMIAFCLIVVSACTKPKIYEIGDRGPAGGFIFYDKGSVSDGWRYLEAAPANTEFNAEWGADGTDVPRIQTGIGTGKANTQIIVNSLQQLGETERAAQRCVILNIGGKKDWFLPSIDELYLLYENLHLRGLGDFSTTSFYWSSSQDDSSDYTAWGQNFVNGSQDNYFKSNPSRVRAVRAF